MLTAKLYCFLCVLAFVFPVSGREDHALLQRVKRLVDKRMEPLILRMEILEEDLKDERETNYRLREEISKLKPTNDRPESVSQSTRMFRSNLKTLSHGLFAQKRLGEQMRVSLTECKSQTSKNFLVIKSFGDTLKAMSDRIDELQHNQSVCSVRPSCPNSGSRPEAGVQMVTTTEGPLPADCWEQKMRHPTSTTGWYKVQPPQGLNRSSLSVYCDMDTAGGGWTVFQRRHDGSVSFNQKYHNYTQGFGNNVEFWMGNDALYAFTNIQPQQLRVDLCDWDTTTAHATYETFSVGPPSGYFRLNVIGYSGDAGDSLDYTKNPRWAHNQRQFSAPDVDRDRSGGNCAEKYQSGWWFEWCFAANLNGRHYSESPAKPTWKGIQWGTWKAGHPFKAAEMKFRPRSANPKSTQPFVCS